MEVFEGGCDLKSSEIGIAAEVGDSVLYHSLLRLASPQQVWGSLSEMGTICSSGLPTRNAPNDVPGPWRVSRYLIMGRPFSLLVVRSFDHLFSYGRSPRPRSRARALDVGDELVAHPLRGSDNGASLAVTRVQIRRRAAVARGRPGRNRDLRCRPDSRYLPKSVAPL